MSATYEMSEVFTEYYGVLYKLNWPPPYDWNTFKSPNHNSNRYVKYSSIIALHWLRYDVLWSTGRQYWPRPKVAVNITFSVLHNTWYCTKWSAVIVLLHLTFHVFCVYMDQFLGIVCCFFQIQNTWADPFNIIDTCTNAVCTNIYY
jgi:hypothetical protein